MTPSFNKNTKSYKLLISTSSKQITINPETVNTMFGTEIIYNGTTVSDTTINVSAGDTIVVKMTDPWGMATDTLPEYTYTVAKSSSSSGGSSSGGSSSGTRSISTSTAQPSGTWKRDDIGWWYQYSDGTYPTSGWRTLAWNGQYKWYHFDKIGYMDTGWFTDIDGHRYFLYPVSDGEQGKMLTGWQRIEGLWYYFYETSGSPLGSLAINTTIGGYKVDSNGAWLQ